MTPHALTGNNIICFSTADWDTLLPTNKHHLMRRLARRGNRVLYIETLGTRRPNLASTTDLGRIGRRLRRGLEGARRREKNLWTLSPVVRPSWRGAASRTANQAAFAFQARAALARFPRPIVWAYSPYTVYLLRHLKPALVVYHLVDDLSAVPGADAAAIREAESEMIARADCVFCTERSLYDRAKLINSRARYMPNVADYNHFVKPRRGVKDSRLDALRSLPHPRIVFSGNLAPHKVDLRLLAQLATARPQWSFVLIGPEWEGASAQNQIARLRAQPNVTLTGHVQYRDLSAYLHEADVLLIPYVKNDATRAVFPLKFFEYFATGKPVVTSPLPSLLAFKEAVRFADSPAEWISAIETSLADPEMLADQRRELARRYTWDARIKEMEEDILEALSRRKQGI